MTLAAVNANPITVLNATVPIDLTLPLTKVEQNVSNAAAANFSVALRCPDALPANDHSDILPLALNDARLSSMYANVTLQVLGGPAKGTLLPVKVLSSGTVAVTSIINVTMDRGSLRPPISMWGFETPESKFVPSDPTTDVVLLAYYILEVQCGQGRPVAQVACSSGSYGRVVSATCLGTERVPLCAAYDLKQNVWSSAGCVPTAHDSSSVTCSCTHLTDFATRFAAVGQTQQAVFSQALTLTRNGPFSSRTAFVGYALVFACCGGILLLSLLLYHADLSAARRYYDALVSDPELQALAQLESMKSSTHASDGAAAGIPWLFDTMIDPPTGYVPSEPVDLGSDLLSSRKSGRWAAKPSARPHSSLAPDTQRGYRNAEQRRVAPGTSRSENRGLSARNNDAPTSMLVSLDAPEPHSAALYVHAVMHFNEHRVTAADVLRADAIQDPLLTTRTRHDDYFSARDGAEAAVDTASKAWLEAAAVLPTPEADEVSCAVSEVVHRPQLHGLCRPLCLYRAPTCMIV